MALPTAVQKISDNAEALAQEAINKSGSQAQPAEGGQQAAPNADPAPKAQSDGDPGNWEGRFKNYKAATDSTISELRSTLSAVQATLAQTQQTNQQLSEQLMAAPSGDNPAPSATEKDEKAYQDWLARLPENMRDEYEDNYLRDQFAFLQSTTNPAAEGEVISTLKNQVEELTATQTRTKVERYEDALDEAYPGDAWINLTKEPEWNDFVGGQISPADRRTFGEVVGQGSASHDASTVIWVLQQYEQHKSALNSGSNNAPNPLEMQLSPDTAGAGSDAVASISEQAESFTLTQVNQFFTDVATTKKYTAEEAAAIEKSIQKAQAAGKIIQG